MESRDITLLQELEANNGISGLQILQPNEVQAATQVFYRDGFVVVKDVLDPEQTKALRRACEEEAEKVVEADLENVGNRGKRRYSWGTASLTNSVFHRDEWLMLVDLPTVTPLLTQIFGSPNYHVRRAAGDFCLPGSMYQPLHADIHDHANGFFDPRGLVSIRDLPCPVVCCNFLAQDFTSINGPTRQIPGTQNSREKIPDLKQEPLWMKYSTVCPAPAGSVLVRDIRAWHGGTPNVSEEMRAIPNVVFLAPWFHERQVPSLSREKYDSLSEHGKRICQFIVSERPLETGYTFDADRKRQAEIANSGY